MIDIEEDAFDIAHREWLARQVGPTDRVTVTVSEMPPIPANSNPFHHDASSMGSDLVRGWMVMHEGFDRKDNPMGLQGMYLVNTRSGQRISLKFAKAE